MVKENQKLCWLLSQIRDGVRAEYSKSFCAMADSSYCDCSIGSLRNHDGDAEDEVD